MWLLIFLLLTGQAFADSKQSSFTTSTPASTDFIPGLKYTAPSTYANAKFLISDLMVLFGSGGAGNVGIGTTGYFPVYVGVSTLGTSSMVSVAGNIGIGSSTPTAALDVVGTVNATNFTGNGSALTGISSGGWTDNGTTVSTTTSTDNVGIGTSSAAGTVEVVINGTNKPLMISTAGGLGDLWTVDSNGNLGLGTANPTSKLRVTTSNSTIARLISTATNGTGGGSGNVGIGNLNGAAITSGYKFATLYFLGSEDANNTNGAANAISSYATQDWTTSAIGSRMDFETTQNGSTGRTVRMSVNQANVGIGTFLPNSKFSVAGGSSIGTNSFIQNTAGNGNLFVESNIGIGTYAPTQTLDVNGTIKSTGYIANGNVGISTTAPTTCGCKQYTNGLCTAVGTCS